MWDNLSLLEKHVFFSTTHVQRAGPVGDMRQPTGEPLIGQGCESLIPRGKSATAVDHSSPATARRPAIIRKMESKKPDEREVSADAFRRALEIARAEAGYRASRSSGPGGQHAQKNETRIEAFLELDSCSLDEPAKSLLRERFGRTVRAVSQDERSQLRNRELARERLLEKIRLALEPVAKRTATKPSRSAILSRLTAKRHRSLTKRRRRPPGAEE